MRFRVRAVTLVLTVALVMVPGLWAQTSRGSISGTVTDQTGALVVNATVTIANDHTGATRETQTNSAGLYRFDAVDLGTYTVTVKAPNFATSVTKNFPVAAARNMEHSVELIVGTEATVMTVEATSEAVLQTTEQVRGGTFSARTVANLPLAGLDSLNVILLNPGALAANTTAFSNGSNQYSVNGSRARSNNFLIDGVENNDISVAGPAFTLTNQDAVQEVSVQTSNFSSEFGRAGGGVINQVIKSGTNTLHGTAEHIYLSHVFNASDNLERLGCADPAGCKSKFVSNIPAFTVGGPVYIPRIYDGRNKTHFFAAGQWDRSFSEGDTRVITIPTAEGIATLQSLPAVCTAAGTNLGTYLGILTSNNIAAASITTIPLFPAPGVLPTGYADLRLQVTTGGCGGNNRAGMGIRVGPFQRSAGQFFLDYNYQIRIDHIASQKQTMSFRWLYDKNSAGPFFNNLPGFDRGFNGITLTGAFADTYMFSPRLTNEFRFNYGRIGFNFPLTDPSGLAGTLPSFSMTGVTGFGGATNIPQFRFANNWQYQDTISWTRGKHQFRFGADFLRQLARQHPPFNERGSISYVNSSSTFGATFNRGFANFIDDFGGSSSAAVTRAFGSGNFQGVYYPNLFRQAYFFNDAWKIRENLTLNLGLRYENFGQPANIFFHPAFDNYSTTEFNQPNRVNPDNNNFGPSVGFAWSPKFENGPLHWLVGNDKTVIRGGYGISYEPLFNNILSNIAGSSPNTLGGSISSAASVCPPPPAACTPRGTANWFSAVFPTVTATPPTAASAQNNLLDPNIQNPYTQHFSFGVQRELPTNTILDVSYVGSLGRHLFQSVDMNPRAGFDVAGNLRPRIQIIHPTCATTAQSQCSRTIRSSTGTSNYNSLQVSVRRGYSSTPVGSLSIAGAYTWSHGFDTISEIFASDSTSDPFASRNLLLGGRSDVDYASNDFDIRHRGVINWVWDIRGPQSGILGQVLGGWGVAGVVQLQTGAPFTIRNGLDRDGDGRSLSDRPNLGNPDAPFTSRGLVVPVGVFDPNAVVTRCPTGLFDIDAEVCTTADQVHWIGGDFLLGLPTGNTTGRNQFRFPHTQRWDLSLTKKFRITERFQLQYRAELLNAFNRQNFGVDPNGGNQPVRSVGSGFAGDGFLDLTQTEAAGRSIRMRLKLIF